VRQCFNSVIHAYVEHNDAHITAAICRAASSFMTSYVMNYFRKEFHCHQSLLTGYTRTDMITWIQLQLPLYNQEGRVDPMRCTVKSTADFDGNLVQWNLGNPN
jgi:hypothetical protein